ncbi:MAG: hypothetical protein R8M11_04365 [Gallionella sp.]
MPKSKYSLFAAFSLLGLLLSGCVTTQVTAVWKDPSYQAKPETVMVIGMAKNPLNRRLFEDEFVLQLEAKGSKAIASYTVLTDQQQEDQAAIAEKVVELGADTVLITRLVSKKTVQVYMPGALYYPPPFYGTWPNYYGYGYRNLYSPGYFSESEYVVIETNLYRADDDKLIWAASSETGLHGSDHGLMKSYISVMVKAMIENGLLTKGYP